MSKEKVIKDYLLTLTNKRPDNLSTVASMENMKNLMYGIVRDRMLTKNIELESGETTADWSESDVESWIEKSVMPYSEGLYEILSANTEEEFKESYKRFITEYPAGEEKQRGIRLLGIINSDIPRTNYVAKQSKKIRKQGRAGKAFIESITKSIYEEVQPKTK